MANPIAEIVLSKIRLDGGAQCRAELDEDHIAELREVLRENGQFDKPISVVYDGKDYIPFDGYHRIAAYFAEWEESNHKKFGAIYAEVVPGTLRDAQLLACGANAKHGLKRTVNDKRRAVLRLLGDEEWSRWSNSEIARRCAVDESTVRKYRGDSSSGFPKMRTVERNGAIFPMNVTAIGRAAPPDEDDGDDDTPRPATAKASTRVTREGVRWSFFLPAKLVKPLDAAAAKHNGDWDTVIVAALEAYLAGPGPKGKRRAA